MQKNMECLPIKTLEELEAWTPNKLVDCKVCSVPIAERKERSSATPRTLLCHDMCGGYLKDRFVQGSEDQLPYRFYHWQYIDSFIYFSHYFVTVPPVTWINAAHKHGVKVLGTFITEWDDGKIRSQRLLESEDSFRKVASKLVEITKYYKFDGWLINIENVIESDKVENLCKFVGFLTDQLHAEVPGSQVIWYDSVLNTGELKWQNELNSKNCMFFDACDGIFLNYNWKDETLHHSLTLARDKGRDMDVYVGIDVFGRGCLGGGGYNTVEALAAIRRFNMSAAIFAQGWVWETQGKEKFTENENRFWSLLDCLLPSNETNCMPLSTTFCQGFGEKYSLLGKVIREEAWYNLSLQDTQPTCTNSQFLRHQLQFQPSIDLCTEDPFTGGACLKLGGRLSIDGQPLLFRLFDTSLTMPPEDVIVSYTYKVPDTTSCGLFLQLEVHESNGSKRLWILRDREVSQTPQNMAVYSSLSSDEVLELIPNATVTPSNGWITRYFCIKSNEEFILKSINFGLQSAGCLDRQSVQIGHLQIISKKDLQSLPTDKALEHVQWEDEEQGGCKVTWQCSKDSAVTYYNVYSTSEGSKTLLGQSKLSCFYTDVKNKGHLSVQPVFYSTVVGKETTC
ncbi:cytosolic endo-beta-N-acetylglucosaminidase-like [Ostrea edulis]|uniref:cytosolic endo-beta-N-acetylglucosaminidase-like n=1 Tax=Ostrea edulis TaxID=37623 RepID=UPI002094751F|nr:cytosolic endo-beta-N-acetylglucosaminidase-like [Ostrea edulis]